MKTSLAERLWLRARCPNSESGGALIVVMIAMLAIAALTVDLVRVINQKHRNIVRNNVLIGRSALEVDLRRLSRFGPTIYASIAVPASVNTDLRSCVLDDSVFDGKTNDCRSKNSDGSDAWYPVQVISDGMTGTTQMISGDSATNSIVYDKSGHICSNPNSVICAFRVYSEFHPTCDSGSVCNLATKITYRFHIDPIGSFAFLHPHIIRPSVVIYDPNDSSFNVVKVGEVEPPPPPPQPVTATLASNVTSAVNGAVPIGAAPFTPPPSNSSGSDSGNGGGDKGGGNGNGGGDGSGNNGNGNGNGGSKNSSSGSSAVSSSGCPSGTAAGGGGCGAFNL